ncbi:MAG: N-acetylmuramoyl-L-alanine amidase [Chloroflexi bacterium]|nr:N-acetylmuramoyl-L-alanine amidase [Chloroflexota bacterium]
MKQLAHSPIRRAIVPILLASLAVGALPAVHIEARGPVRVAASEVHVSLEGERTLALPIAASHLALHWAGQAGARVMVAFSADGLAFGPPISVERDEVGESRANGETYGNLLLAGGAHFVRVTSDRPLAHLAVLALDAHGSSQASIGFGEVAAAAVSQPEVISRAGWIADESLRFDAARNEIWPAVFQPIQKLIVHHAATQNRDPDPAATVRAIYYYHAVTQGWGDIGYNFLIDEAGRIYEGRHSRTYLPGETPTGQDAAGNGVTGAHALGFNSGTVGVALLGTLTGQDATPAARDALGRLLAWIAGSHNLDPHGSALYINPVNGTQATFPNIAGHRDVNATECPGGTFYATLPALRDAVAALISGTATPDFSLALSPTSQPVRGGRSVNYTVTVTALNGFTGAVSLSVSGLPSQSVGTFNPTSVAPGGTSILTIKTATTPRGTFTFTVTGTSDSLSQTATGILQVTKR